MDFINISTGVVLLVILIAWYALLEYEEKRQGRDSEGRKQLSAFISECLNRLTRAQRKP
jgi:hypothetical protein